MVAGDGRVRPDDFLSATIGLFAGSTNRDVLADREAEDGGGSWQFEAVATTISIVVRKQDSVFHKTVYSHGSVVGQNGLLLELEILESIWLKELLGL